MTEPERLSAAELEMMRRRLITRVVPFMVVLAVAIFLLLRLRGIGLPIASAAALVPLAVNTLLLSRFSRKLAKNSEAGDWTANGEGPIA